METTNTKKGVKIMNKNKNKKQIKSDIQGIADLISYGEQYPQGAIKIGYHYYNVTALTDALQDIRTRHAIGGDTNKADKLLVQILSGLV
jgi:hypothetical protein